MKGKTKIGTLLLYKADNHYSCRFNKMLISNDAYRLKNFITLNDISLVHSFTGIRKDDKKKLVVFEKYQDIKAIKWNTKITDIFKAYKSEILSITKINKKQLKQLSK